MPSSLNKSETIVNTLGTGHFREDCSYSVLREDGSASWLLILTIAGGGRVGYKGGDFETRLGDLCLFQPLTYQLYETSSQLGFWEFLWTHFQPRPHWDSILKWPVVGPGVSRVKPDPHLFPHLQSRMTEVDRLSRRIRKVDEMLALNALEEILIHGFAAAVDSSLRIDERIQLVIEFIDEKFHEPLTVEDLARHTSLSVSRFSHLFQSQIGVSPRSYLERLRLTRARQALEMTTRKVSVIAAETGFTSPFYFSLRFKEWIGMSPSEYRQAKRANVETNL